MQSYPPSPAMSSFDFEVPPPMEYSLSGTSIDSMPHAMFPHNHASSFPGQLDFSMLYSSSADSTFPPMSPTASEPADDCTSLPMDVPYPLDHPSPVEYEPPIAPWGIPIPRSHGEMNNAQMFSISPVDQSPTFPSGVPVSAPRRRQPRVDLDNRSSRHTFPCDLCGKCFTRVADVKRHQTSVHDPLRTDCPIESCSRKGSSGFPRRDHLVEHLRSFHHMAIPKRAGAKRKAATLDTDHY